MPSPALRKTAPGRAHPPRDILEESLSVLHLSMEQARSTDGQEMSSPPRKTNQSVDSCGGSVPDSPSSWLLSMFHKREKDHEAEKGRLADHLMMEKQKKHTYKNQLKDALRDRIGWLETQLQSAQQGQCGVDISQERKSDEPTIQTTDTELSPIFPTVTHNSSSSVSIQPDLQHQARRRLILSQRNKKQASSPRRRRKTIISPRQGEEGYEITFQQSEHPISPNARIRQLEHTLKETVEDFEKERAEWLKAVEEATSASQAGSRLSAQQERQLQDLEKQVQVMPESERMKWQEKTRVLKELLDLTEQQQSNEIKEWEEEVRVFELTVSKLSSERESLLSKARTTEKELADANAKSAMTVKELVEVRGKLEELSRVQVEQQLVFDKTNAELVTLRRENEQLIRSQEGWNREKEIADTTVSQLVADKNAMRKQITMLRKNLHLASPTRPPLPDKASQINELEEKLDRVTSERDIYRQEANQKEDEKNKLQGKIDSVLQEKRAAEQLFDKAREEWENALTDAMSADEREIEMTKEWEEKMVAKDKKIRDLEAQVVSERHQFEENLEAERSKLRADFAAKENHLRCETDLQIQELKLKQEDELREMQLTDGELAVKLKESVDKRNDLVQRLRKLEQQRSKERGDWKLQLETALAQSRTGEATIQELKDKLERQAKRHEQATKDNSVQLRELQEKLETATEESESKLSQAQAAKEEVETQLDQVRESLKQKENELDRMKENHTNELQRKENELQSLATEKKNITAQLQEKAAQLAGSKADSRVLNERMNDMKNRLKEVWEVKEKREQKTEECKAQLEQKRSEILSLTKKLKEAQKRFEEASDLNEKRARELDEWKSQAEEARAEAGDRREQVLDLTNRLDDLQKYHDSSTKSLEAQIDRSLEGGNGASVGVSRGVLEHHRNSICEAVKELRKDVLSMRDTAVSPSKINEIRDDLDQLKETLDDVAAELTLETEAMFETRTAVESLAKESTASRPSDSSGFLQQQEVMFAQISEMNSNIQKLFELGSSSDDQDAVRLQLVTELKCKEERLLKCNAELQGLAEKLAAEVEKREKAEAEVVTLNDQADAYGEEMIRLQTENTNLQATLKEAERKMMAVLGSDGQGDGDVDSVAEVDNKDPSNHNESPLLDDALALAESLSQIVQGDDGKETSVLKMLETLQDRLDQHERARPLAANPLNESAGEKGHLVRYTGAPSAPQVPEEMLPTPPGDTPIGVEVPANGGSALKILVEQLHARCQLLERERLEMMEVTLDLLESARQSSKAELDAALATARRKATEDMIRMGEEVYKDREVLYNKLCSQCVHGLTIKPSHSLNSEEDAHHS